MKRRALVALSAAVLTIFVSPAHAQSAGDKKKATPRKILRLEEMKVEGRIQKWFAESVLLDQQWFRDPGQTVRQAIGDMQVIDFAVYALG